jgi:alkanesulfonate monooxygenase SsuD/methylene tetrahydromethanopterin reductase-like flavin-dependent oxidoreductase (luciferase family)
MAGINVIAAASDADAREQFELTRRARVRNLFSRNGKPLTEDQVDGVLRSPQAAHVDEMLTYCAVGEPALVAEQIESFVGDTGADELVTVHPASTVANRLRSVELLAEAVQLGI